MDARIERHGALSVVRQVDSRDQVQRALRLLDDRLFLEQQVDFEQKPVWCVVCDVGLNDPPIAIYEWRDPSGEPIAHPSMQIYEAVAAMERDGHKLAQRVIEQNRALIERRREDARRNYRDVMEDILPRMSGKRSAVLPRSQALRMSRDRRRANGEKV